MDIRLTMINVRFRPMDFRLMKVGAQVDDITVFCLRLLGMRITTSYMTSMCVCGDWKHTTVASPPTSMQCHKNCDAQQYTKSCNSSLHFAVSRELSCAHALPSTIWVI